MGTRYGKSYEIGSKAMKRGLVTLPSDMFDLMQEIATFHSDSLGYTMDYFDKEQKGWALISQYAEFNRLPGWREVITLETWSTTCEKMVANRCYRIIDKEGNIIMEALSKWVFMDKAKKRPVKPPADILEAYASGLPELFEGVIPDIPDTEGSKHVSGSEYVVKRSSTDYNLHVNNVRYIIWAEDDIPDETFCGKAVKTVNVSYKKECLPGTHIKTCCYETAKDEYVNLIKDDEDNVLAVVMLAF